MLPDAISSPTLLCPDTFLRQNNWKSLQHHLNGGIFGNIRAKHAVMAWNEHNQRRDRSFDLACQHNKMKQSHSNSSLSVDNNCTFCEKLKFYPKKEFCATWQHLLCPTLAAPCFAQANSPRGILSDQTLLWARIKRNKSSRADPRRA